MQSEDVIRATQPHGIAESHPYARTAKYDAALNSAPGDTMENPVTNHPRSQSITLAVRSIHAHFTLPLTACVIAMLASCTANRAEPGIVRAQLIQMVDADGNVRAELGVDAEGSAGLFLYDLDGRTRVALIHDPSQIALYLFDDQEVTRVGAAQFSHGGGGFALHGEESKGVSVLYMKDGAGSLTLQDKNGTLLGRMPAQTAAARNEE